MRTHVPPGETYAHTVTEVGQDAYVCVPHAAQGMVGTVHVVARR